MNMSFYENHVMKDPNFPLIFHFDKLIKNSYSVPMHWHENIEILYFVGGSALIACDTMQHTANTGDIAIINFNNLHWINSITENCSYYCLIIDKSFCESFDIPIDEIVFKNIVNDISIREYFDLIIEEMCSKRPYYESAVKSDVIRLMIHLCRHYKISKPSLPKTKENFTKIDKIKSVISYIKLHYRDDISIDDISLNVGFSKYYLCHNFKDITGKTLIDYINYLRCNYAKILLSSGKYNVSESCFESGFNNLSYFCKTYKKIMGLPPSKQKL